MSDATQGAQPRLIRLQDYQAPAYFVDQVDLSFMLDEDQSQVRACLQVRRNPDYPEAEPLQLDGHDLKLLSVHVDGMALTPLAYDLTPDMLRIPSLPAQFQLDIVTEIMPQKNTSLEGLYKSSGNFCTQCEAEGFRRITYYPDRPDVMAVFTVRIEASAADYPVLLSNGNKIASGALPDGRHWVQWHDPYPKPSYLFALVAGKLSCVSDNFTTQSGRRVDLELYVQAHNVDKCAHALQSLKKSMRWDEEIYGREYDLDLFMIVAVDDFNMGAMENKGLNIFNSSCVLAKPATATDADYQNIERIVAHEYFHNWSGNRVTCRDWFQLSLKEGFTVFRDQEFSADVTSRAVKRIHDVNVLRTHQFREDAGPMAHPVRPDSYVEINNFYTVTVYNKGAEVVRMLHTLLGPAGFRRGTDLYFSRHDGQAVTTDDFVRAMEDANHREFSQFRRWYSQAGTPELKVSMDYDAAAHSCTLKVTQHCGASPGQAIKQDFHIPLALALLDRSGKELPLRFAGESAAVTGTRVLEISREVQEFVFVDIPERPVPSLLRDFSAPVKMTTQISQVDAIFLMGHDTNAFNRWDVTQQLLIATLLRMCALEPDAQGAAINADIIDALRHTLISETLDEALIAQAVSLPAEAYIAEFMPVIDPEAIHYACRALRLRLCHTLHDELLRIYDRCADAGPYRTDAAAVGRRSLKNVCLGYLMEGEQPAIIDLCRRQYEQANNMTDRMAALVCLVNAAAVDTSAMLHDFYEAWQQDNQMMEKWLAVQASCRLPDTLDCTRALLSHPAFSFKNPNKVRALIGGFAGNSVNFHRRDGAGYAFVAAEVLRLNDFNPIIAARLVSVFTQWRRYDRARQELMQAQLQRLADHEQLSKDVYEIVSRSLQ